MSIKNIIVHSEYALIAEDNAKVSEFSEEIARISDPSVVLADVSPRPENRDQEDLLLRIHGTSLADSADRYRSNGFFIEGDYFPFGHIREGDWNRFVTDLDGADEVRIHGCFIGQACTMQLAIQIYGFQTEQTNWFDWKCGPPRHSTLKYRARIAKLELNRGLLKSKIRYGTVFSNESILTSQGKKPPYRTPFFSRSLDEQLIDSKTQIFK